MSRSLVITVGALVAALFASWAASSNAAGNSKVAIFAGGCAHFTAPTTLGNSFPHWAGRASN